MRIDTPGTDCWDTVARLLMRQIDYYEKLIPLLPRPHAYSPRKTRMDLLNDIQDKKVILDHFKEALAELIK